MGERIHTHLVWADNIYLMATIAEHLQIMIQDTTDALAEEHLHWKLSAQSVIVGSGLE